MNHEEPDNVIYMRVPQAIVDFADTMVETSLYANRTEVLRELLRNGMKFLLYHNHGGYCIDLKKIVDYCHNKSCKNSKTCQMYTKIN